MEKDLSRDPCSTELPSGEVSQADANDLWRRLANGSVAMLVASVVPAARIERANAAFCRLLGYPDAFEMAGQPLRVVSQEWESALRRDSQHLKPNLAAVDLIGSGGQKIRATLFTIWLQANDPATRRVLAVAKPTSLRANIIPSSVKNLHARYSQTSQPNA